MDQIIYGFFWLFILVGILALTLALNKKTPVPEGCEELTASCSGCKDITCFHNPKIKEEK